MQLEMQLHRLKNEMENVVLDCKELEEQLHVAIKERAMMKMMLMELEQEHDEAILKIEQLQGEVKNQIFNYLKTPCFIISVNISWINSLPQPAGPRFKG